MFKRMMMVGALAALTLGSAMALVACGSAEKILATAEVTYHRLGLMADSVLQRPRCPQPEGTMCIEQADASKIVRSAEVADKALDDGWVAFDAFKDAPDADAKIDAAANAAAAAVDVFLSALTAAGVSVSELHITNDHWQVAVLPDGQASVSFTPAQ